MKLNVLFLPALVALGGVLNAAPLTRPTPVHAGPNESAAVITILTPGSELTPALMTPAPTGWSAVTLAGPHEAYVQNNYIAKDLTIKPDSPLYAAPDTGATLMTKALKDDPIEITGLRGRWTQLRLNRPIVGYVRTSVAATPTPSAPSPAAQPVENMRLTDSAQQGNAAPIAGATARPAPPRATGAAVETLPRLFEGTVVTTRAPFRPRRPYDYAIADESGNRLAYLDFSKLMQLSQIEAYIDRRVTAYGPVEAVPDSNDIVVRVESLRLR